MQQQNIKIKGQTTGNLFCCKKVLLPDGRGVVIVGNAKIPILPDTLQRYTIPIPDLKVSEWRAGQIWAKRRRAG